MSKALEQHIEKFISIAAEDRAPILEFFRVLKPGKKENLLSEGQVCKANYFVVKGCLRLFFITDKGIEKTVQFAIENWWLADYASFESQQPSGFYIQAVEPSEVLALDYAAQQTMFFRFPRMERYFRLVHQKAHAAFQQKTKYTYELSREEVYRQFNRNFPEFIQRIPQYLLASYLGMTPEYLSELRAKNIS